jgi:hypothetical protein
MYILKIEMNDVFHAAARYREWEYIKQGNINQIIRIIQTDLNVYKTLDSSEICNNIREWKSGTQNKDHEYSRRGSYLSGLGVILAHIPLSYTIACVKKYGDIYPVSHASYRENSIINAIYTYRLNDLNYTSNIYGLILHDNITIGIIIKHCIKYDTSDIFSLCYELIPTDHISDVEIFETYEEFKPAFERDQNAYKILFAKLYMEYQKPKTGCKLEYFKNLIQAIGVFQVADILYGLPSDFKLITTISTITSPEEFIAMIDKYRFDILEDIEIIPYLLNVANILSFADADIEMIKNKLINLKEKTIINYEELCKNIKYAKSIAYDKLLTIPMSNVFIEPELDTI